MTDEEAVRNLHGAICAAIESSEAVKDAVRALADIGLRIESLYFVATTTGALEGLKETDADFLRKLRISPDLEVRE